MPDTIQAVTRFPLDSSWSRSATPFLMSPYTLSTRHQRFAYAHLQISHLTGSCPAFSVTLTTLTLNQRSSRWFGNHFWKSSPEGHPPSFLQLRAIPSCSRGTPDPKHAELPHWAPASGQTQKRCFAASRTLLSPIDAASCPCVPVAVV